MSRSLAILGLTIACADTPNKDPDGSEGQVLILAGTAELGFNGDDLPAIETRLASPSSVYEGPDGDIIIVDFSNMRVRVINDDGTIGTRVGNGFHAYSEEGANPLDSPLENPIDIAWKPNGELCVLPLHEGRVVCLNETNRIERFAGTGAIADGGDGGPALDATMGFVSGLAFAEDGTLFVSDSTHSRVRRVTPDGIIDTVLGTGQGGLGQAGFGPEMMVRFPERMVLDEAQRRLIVADTYNHRVLSLDIDTLDTTVLAGTGQSGRTGDDGPASEAQLNTPIGVALGPNGGILISDNRNFVIRHINPEGTMSTVVGTGEYEITEEETDRFNFNLKGPSGISWTTSGDLLIAEQFGHRILKVKKMDGLL